MYLYFRIEFLCTTLYKFSQLVTRTEIFSILKDDFLTNYADEKMTYNLYFQAPLEAPGAKKWARLLILRLTILWAFLLPFC